MKLVSVVVPVYNASQYVDECLLSIVNQSYSNIEVIAIDDGSSDDSLKILNKWTSKDKRIKVLSQNNQGVSSTRNRGINQASGDYLCFVDADDIVSPEYIRILVDGIERNRCDCFICNIQSFKKNEEIRFSDGYEKTYYPGSSIEALFGEFHGYLANKIYKKAIIDQYSIRLNTSLHIAEDLLFNYDYWTVISKVGYYSGILYRYRQYDFSSYNNLHNEKWFSILKTYSILMEKSMENKGLNNRLLFLNKMLLLEGSYRLCFCEKLPLDIKSNIKKETKFKNLISPCFSIWQNSKLLIFKFFPRIVMFYKRRKI